MKNIAILAGAVLLVSGCYAHAADAVAQETIPEATQTYNWSGLYVLGSVGYGSGKTDYEHQNVNNFGGPGGTYGNDGNGAVYGGAIGYNLAFSNGFVLGVEGAIRTGANQDDGGEFEVYHNTTSTDSKILYNVTGKVGYAVGSFLPYVKAGWAGGDVEASQNYHPVGLEPTTWSDKKFASGYVVGGGVDYAVTDKIIVGIEYNYTDLGKINFGGLDSTGKETDISGKFHEHTVMLHAGFKF